MHKFASVLFRLGPLVILLFLVQDGRLQSGASTTLRGPYDCQTNSTFPQVGVLTSVSPVSESTIIAVGDSTMIRTTDGGISWSVRHRPEGVGYLSSLHFVDSLRGWCVGTRSVLSTTDGGMTWSRQDITSDYLSTVFFTDSLHGWIAGNVTLFGTTDGGTTWAPRSSGFGFSSIFFINSRIGWATRGSLYRTTDGGESWSLSRPAFGWASYRSVFFVDSLHGWAGGSSQYQHTSLLIRTTDGGKTWATMAPSYGSIRSITFVDSSRGWFLEGADYVCRTTDGGTTWDTSAHFFPVNLFNVRNVKNSNHVWTVGTHGLIAKSTDEGITWTRAIVTEVRRGHAPLKFFLYQNYPNPFNPSTTIRYQIPTLTHVALKVFDVLGREVTTLVDEVKQVGDYSAQFDGSNLSSGAYFYQLRANGQVRSKKMILTR